MTPQREKYLAKCSEREILLRNAIYITKSDISWQKQIISNANEEWIATGAKCELWHLKQLLKTLRHELARLKGIMDRVVVPARAYVGYYGDKGGLCKCEKHITDRFAYCPDCGRRILWEKVK